MTTKLVGDQKTNEAKKEKLKSRKSYNLKNVGHTNNQKGIEKSKTTVVKENARKEAANKIQTHSSFGSHTLQTHHHSILHFYLQPVC
jgi:hypothetical protein